MQMILGVSALILMTLVGCTYGPLTRQASIANVALRPGTTGFAAAVHVHIFRPPTGLSAFPDGGKQKTLEEYGLFYLCDAHRRTASLLGRLNRPKEFISGSEPWAIGWQADTLYVKFICEVHRSNRNDSPGPESRGLFHLGQGARVLLNRQIPRPVDHRENVERCERNARSPDIDQQGPLGHRDLHRHWSSFSASLYP